MSESPQPYRVLARKYRPQSFDQLIGQEAMVRTLRNAIETGRLAHAFMLWKAWRGGGGRKVCRLSRLAGARSRTSAWLPAWNAWR